MKNLFQKYRYLFPADDSNEPISHFGIECSKGWTLLLDNVFTLITSRYNQALWSLDHAKVNDKNPDLIAELEKEVAKHKSELPVICQVKSKFSTLRIYSDNTTPYVNGVVAMAEQMSASICEFCGERGTRTGSKWVTTLCKSCEDFNNDNKKL